MENSAEFEEEITDDYFRKKFTLPNVKEGAVIEYTYTISSDFEFSLKPWQFQWSIPTIYSEYTTEIPEYYDYNKNMQGYLMAITSPSKSKSGSIGTGTNALTYSIDIQKLVVKDAPAFKAEDYITTLGDYVSLIEYNLRSFNFPGQMTQRITPSWGGIVNGLLKSEGFGNRLKARGDLKDVAAQ
jgi:hypothetical protein